MGLISFKPDKLLGGGVVVQKYFSALEKNVCVCVRGGGGYAKIFYRREKMLWGGGGRFGQYILWGLINCWGERGLFQNIL